MVRLVGATHELGSASKLKLLHSCTVEPCAVDTAVLPVLNVLHVFRLETKLKEKARQSTTAS